MAALEAPEFELNNAQEMAGILQQAQSWREIEAITSAYPQWKEAAWNLLSESSRNRIKKLKKWSDHTLVKNFPLGSTVQRIDDTEEQKGKVTDYWTAYGIDYVTFQVGADTDWCRAEYLKRIYQ